MFLCASFNLIEKVCDISSLKSLLFLDLSNNKINSIDPGWIKLFSIYVIVFKTNFTYFRLLAKIYSNSKPEEQQLWSAQ